MKRGETWWVSLDPAKDSEIRKIRPAVILTVEPLNRARRTVVTVPLSSSPDPRPPIVIAVPSAGSNSVAVCDRIRAVDKSRLTRQSGRLSDADLKAAEDGVRTVLGL